MRKLRLMVPKPEHKETVMKFRKEFLNAGEKVSERVFFGIIPINAKYYSDSVAIIPIMGYIIF